MHPHSQSKVNDKYLYVLVVLISNGKFEGRGWDLCSEILSLSLIDPRPPSYFALHWLYSQFYTTSVPLPLGKILNPPLISMHASLCALSYTTRILTHTYAHTNTLHVLARATHTHTYIHTTNTHNARMHTHTHGFSWLYIFFFAYIPYCCTVHTTHVTLICTTN